jgi:hypothetical protein
MFIGMSAIFFCFIFSFSYRRYSFITDIFIYLPFDFNVTINQAVSTRTWVLEVACDILSEWGEGTLVDFINL